MHSPLIEYYDYWDKFIDEWKTFIQYNCHCKNSNEWGHLIKQRYSHLTQWSYPKMRDAQMWLNGQNRPQMFNPLNYIPGGWWGNACKTKCNNCILNHCNTCENRLEAVVINYNPKADTSNLISTKNSPIGNKSFSNYVKESLVECKDVASNWHNTRRAIPIFTALNSALKTNKFGTTKSSIRNLLSIELVPWSTQNMTQIIDYVSMNRIVIFEKVIKFAATASKNINNDFLKNIVLVRISDWNFKQFLGSIGGLKYIQTEREINNSGTKFSIYEFKEIPNVKFVCIWSKARNNFPKNLHEVFNELAILKKNII